MLILLILQKDVIKNYGYLQLYLYLYWLYLQSYEYLNI